MDILIRDVPEPVHAELVRRAQLENKSLRGYLVEVLRSHTSSPSLSEWLERVRSLPTAGGTRSGAELIALDREEADRATERS